MTRTRAHRIRATLAATALAVAAFSTPAGAVTAGGVMADPATGTTCEVHAQIPPIRNTQGVSGITWLECRKPTPFTNTLYRHKTCLETVNGTGFEIVSCNESQQWWAPWPANATSFSSAPMTASGPCSVAGVWRVWGLSEVSINGSIQRFDATSPPVAWVC